MSTIGLNTEGRFCPACGAAVVEGGVFCAKCGARIFDMADAEAAPTKSWFTQASNLDASPSDTRNSPDSPTPEPQEGTTVSDRSVTFFLVTCIIIMLTAFVLCFIADVFPLSYDLETNILEECETIEGIVFWVSLLLFDGALYLFLKQRGYCECALLCVGLAVVFFFFSFTVSHFSLARECSEWREYLLGLPGFYAEGLGAEPVTRALLTRSNSERVLSRYFLIATVISAFVLTGVIVLRKAMRKENSNH